MEVFDVHQGLVDLLSAQHIRLILRTVDERCALLAHHLAIILHYKDMKNNSVLKNINKKTN